SRVRSERRTARASKRSTARRSRRSGPRPDRAAAVERLRSTGMARVTVLVPTYNRAAYLGATLASIRTQDVPDLQIVVADTAATDDTAALVARFSDDRVHYIRRARNIGWRDNFRLALSDVDGEYVMMVCDDDRLLPGALDRAVRTLDEHPRVALVHSTFRS